jgi:hypothetical protein
MKDLAKVANWIGSHPAMTDPAWTVGKESRTRKPKKSKRNPAGKGKNAKKFGRRKK